MDKAVVPSLYNAFTAAINVALDGLEASSGYVYLNVSMFRDVVEVQNVPLVSLWNGVSASLIYVVSLFFPLPVKYKRD